MLEVARNKCQENLDERKKKSSNEGSAFYLKWRLKEGDQSSTPQRAVLLARLYALGYREDALKNFGLLDTNVLIEAIQNEKNPLLLKQLLKAQADAGNAFAQYDLYRRLLKSAQFEEARKYLERAAKQNIKEAQLALGLLLEEEGKSKSGEFLTKRAADEGNAAAQYKVGVLLQNSGDLVQAIKHYVLAEDQGSKDAENALQQIEKSFTL
jgi:TPR repeat protein